MMRSFTVFGGGDTSLLTPHNFLINTSKSTQYHHLDEATTVLNFHRNSICLSYTKFNIKLDIQPFINQLVYFFDLCKAFDYSGLCL